MAERDGFEPPIRLPVCRISGAVPVFHLGYRCPTFDATDSMQAYELTVVGLTATPGTPIVSRACRQTLLERTGFGRVDWDLAVSPDRAHQISLANCRFCLANNDQTNT